MKKTSLFIARASLFAALIALCPQTQKAESTHASMVPWASSPGVILCGPGLVYRCTPKGCFCVKP
ncbi:MAG: hypothetical protein WA294_13100 [Acidobacteriaceae bacterium]